MLQKESSISTTIVNLLNTITINDTKVVMIAQSRTTFKLLHVLNHWIDNLTEHHQDEEKVNIHQKWYVKWKSIYPFIRSSKQNFLDVYHMITEDYNVTESTVTLFSFTEYFKINYPEFVHFTMISSKLMAEKMIKNFLEFTLNLYYTAYNNGNNIFNELSSSHNSFITFTSNNSVTT
jgi:hypothetical protein